jgi:hypothetical protein
VWLPTEEEHDLAAMTCMAKLGFLRTGDGMALSTGRWRQVVVIVSAQGDGNGGGDEEEADRQRRW